MIKDEMNWCLTNWRKKIKWNVVVTHCCLKVFLSSSFNCCSVLINIKLFFNPVRWILKRLNRVKNWSCSLWSNNESKHVPWVSCQAVMNQKRVDSLATLLIPNIRSDTLHATQFHKTKHKGHESPPSVNGDLY